MAALQVKLLDRSDVRVCLDSVDPVEVVERVLRRHAEGRTELPTEAHLRWNNADGAQCRSLAMLGALTAGETGAADPVLGLKVINAALSNTSSGLERASGVGIIFDPLTARPVMLAEIGLLSAIRTAAYTVLSVRHIGPTTWRRLGLIGAGVQARTHLKMLAADNPELAHVKVYDVDGRRAEALAAWARTQHPALSVGVVAAAQAVTTGSDVVVTATTSTRPYLAPEHLRPGSFVAHVSLDDLDARVFAAAEAIYVDDVNLVRDNPHRILGALMQQRHILPPDAPVRNDARRLAGTLGDVLLEPGRAVRPTTGFVISNPFGMAVLDVGLLDSVRQQADRTTRGQSFAFLADDRRTPLEDR